MSSKWRRPSLHSLVHMHNETEQGGEGYGSKFLGVVRIAGDIKLLAVIASGLPTTEDFVNVTDLEILKAPLVPMDTFVDLFTGIFSRANKFKRRMAFRRTCIQYDNVRSGDVAVRFFVGLVRMKIYHIYSYSYHVVVVAIICIFVHSCL